MRDWSICSSLGKAFSMTGVRTVRSSLSRNSYLRQMTWMTCTAPYTRAMSSVPRCPMRVVRRSGQRSGKSCCTATRMTSVSWERMSSGDWMNDSRMLARMVALSSSCSLGDSSRLGSHPLALMFFRWIAAACRMPPSAWGAVATCMSPTMYPLA